MPIEMLSGFTANISMETQIQQNRRYTTIQLDIIHTGDCLKILKTLPDDSVHCCVTSPPYYALRDYGMEAQIGRETTPKEYICLLYTSRANAEICILATKGHPKRVDAGVRQVILSHIEEHSKKPDEARERIVRLMGCLLYTSRCV